MARSSLPGLLLGFAGCAAPAQQAAPVQPATTPSYQTMTPPAMPFACDLEMAPLGSWADYEGREPWIADPSTTLVALVAKGSEGVIIEANLAGGFNDVVLAFVFSRGNGVPGELRRAAMQDGAYAPMDLPRVKSPGQHFYGRVDPRTLVGEEEVVVRAGKFRTRRYHYLTPFGENVDAWITETAWPICLVKLAAEQRQDPSATGRFSYELVAMGADAKPRITKPVVPFDIEVLKKQDAEKRARAAGAARPPRGPSP